MKFYDAFSGIGGFHEGIKQAHPDWECTGACEINTHSKRVYNRHFKEVTIKIRRLTPTECERLQGFPDGWTKYYSDGTEVSDSQRYKMLGNAVTVPVIKAIAERLKPGIRP